MKASEPAGRAPNHPNNDRSRFEDVLSPLMPTRHAAWQLALNRVDRGRIPVRTDSWRYWIPLPSLLASAQGSCQKSLQLVRGWLLVRPAWLDLLARQVETSQIHEIALGITQWKTILGVQYYPPREQWGVPSGNGVSKWHTILDVEGLVGGSWPTDTDGAFWIGRRAVDEAHVEVTRIVREVIWELCHIGFRADLTALDRAMVPLEDDSRRSYLIQQVFGPCPFFCAADVDAETGLASDDMRYRVASIEGMRQIMRRWSLNTHRIRCMPPMNSRCSPIELDLHEQLICDVYCQTFADIAGRAPIVPRLWPSRPRGLTSVDRAMD